MKNTDQNQITPERPMQFSFAYAPPIIIGAAVDNQIFDTLAEGAKSVEEVAKQTGASIRGLRAVMNALIGLDLLGKDGNGKYLLTPESEKFLLRGKPGTFCRIFQSESCSPDEELDETGRNRANRPTGCGRESRSRRHGIFERISRKHYADELCRDARYWPLPSLMFAVNMLINTDQGDTFSFNEIKSWIEEAGFKNIRTLDVPGPSPLVLATKS